MHLNSVILQSQHYPAVESYPFGLPIFKSTEKLVFDTPVTLFVGENGTGKSTLLVAIAQACGIHIWRNSERSRPEHNPYEDRLHQFISVQWLEGRVPGSFFGAQIFQHFAELLDEWAAADRGQLNYFGGKSLTTQSHGQSLMSFFRSRYAIKGLYLLDEPETALSPRSQIELLNLISSLNKDDHAQFIIATHSPILLGCPGAKIYSFDQSSVCDIGYEQTDHYRLYKSFLEDRNKFLKQDGPT
jgi:predicted ATPase